MASAKVAPFQALEHTKTGSGSRPESSSTAIRLRWGQCRANRRPNLPLFPLQFAAKDGMVNLIDSSAPRTARKRKMGSSFLATTMHPLVPYPGDEQYLTSDASDAAQLAAAVVQQGVDKRVPLVTGKRDARPAPPAYLRTRHASSSCKIEGNIFRLGYRRTCFWPMHLNFFASPRACVGFHYAPSHANVPFLD